MSRTLLVARCDSTRCAGLRRLRDQPEDPVRAAVAGRRDGVLMHTGCLGACTLGAVAALGWASSNGPRLEWSHSPVVLGQVDLPARAAELAGWIADGAPTPASMPSGLRRGLITHARQTRHDGLPP